MIKNLLTNLINKKFYKNKEDIINKCDVFFAMNKINDEEYADLLMKIEEVYAEPIEEVEEDIVLD